MEVDLPDLINDYCNLILAIENDANQDPLWQRFYQIQMAIYILSRETDKLVLENSVKAYQKINRAWDNLNDYFSNSVFHINNIDNLFKTIRIDFLDETN